MCFLALLLFFVSCKKESPVVTVTTSPVFETITPVQPETHRWYYFTKDGFAETSLPAVSPDYPLRPWTQAPRISGTLTGTDTGYLLVNRRGLITLSATDDPELIPDFRLFSGVTADSLVASGNNPAFKLYVNSLFPEKVDSSIAVSDSLPVMVQYNAETNLYYPLLHKSDMHLEPSAQVTAMTADDDFWYFCAKDTDDQKTTFTYLAVPTGVYLQSGDIRRITEAEFRSVYAQQPVTALSDRYKQLLRAVPESISFTLSASDYSQSSRAVTPVQYFRNSSDDPDILHATAQTGPSWTMIVFSDGTCYFAGSLPKLHIVNNGQPVYFRLPALPAGMEYTDFALCGSKLYIGWEEVDFYNTGKAGFLEVLLEKVLY